MVFGPLRGRPDCCVGGVPLPLVHQYRYLGVVLFSTLFWRPHVEFLCSRGDCLFHQASAWCFGECLPLSFSSSVFVTCVLSSSSFGLEFIADDPPAFQQFNLALRRLVSPLSRLAQRFLLLLRYTGNLALVMPFTLPLARLLAFRALVDHASPRRPITSSVFRLSSSALGTWSNWCASVLHSYSIPLPAHVGISTGSPPSSLHQWLSREVNPRLHRALRHRLSAMVSDLHGVLVDVSSDNCLPVIQNPVYSFNLPSSAFRLWGLARWGHDHSSTGHPSRQAVPLVIGRVPSVMILTAPSCIIFPFAFTQRQGHLGSFLWHLPA